HVNFGLAGGRDFVVLLFHHDAHLLHLQHHFAADVLLGVHRRHREVPFLVTGLVAEIGALPAQITLFTGIPDTLVGINKVGPAVTVLIITRAVENKKFGLGAPIGDVPDLGLFEKLFGFLGHVARVPAVVLACDRIHDVTDHAQL